MNATVLGWDAATRALVVDRERIGRQAALNVPPALVGEALVVGRQLRLSFDPLTRTVSRIVPIEVHRRPSAPRPRQP